MDCLKILVVEDDAIVADDICNCLVELNHIPIGPAYNINKAKELFKSTDPKMALLDIHLDGHLDGIEFVKWMAELRTVPVIFLTAFADEKTFNKAKEVHPAHYLIKPFDKVRLKIAIEIAKTNFYFSNGEHQFLKRLDNFNLNLTYPLSRREMEVIKILAGGCSNRELAIKLHLSEHTVKSHLKTIFLKTQSKSRTELLSKINHF